MSGTPGPTSKRPRHDKDTRERSERGANAEPSRVLYLSNLPRNCNENDLGNIMGQFGPITCVQLMRGGREALIEYTDMKIAADVIKTANKKVFNIGPNVVRLEYSNSQTIRRRDSGPMHGMGGNMTRDMHMMDQPMMQRASNVRAQEPTRVLHLDIANAQYPINAEVIYAICSINGREGRVNRICCGKMNPDDSIEVLVEFSSVMDAQKVYEQLNGADIYSGCCTLNISFSKLNRVMVLKNDEMSYDYTSSNPGRGGLLGSQPPGSMMNQTGMMGGHSRMMNNGGGMSLIQQQMSLQGGGQSMAMRRGGMDRDIFQEQMMMQGGMGSHRFGPGPDRRDRGSDGGMGMRMNMGMDMNMRGRGMSMDGPMDGMMQDSDGFVPFETGEGVVVMFYNLDERANCNHLFNLCCLYGNVARIKFLKSRPDCAMVQMGNRMATSLVIQHFNGMTLFDKKIEVSRSKQIEIVEQSKPLKLADGSESSKNFMNDMNNRFRNAYLASQCKIVAPNNTVHFFNAPRHFTPEDMNDLFEKSQATKPKKVAVFPVKDNAKTSLGLVEWDTLDEAMDAMALANHTEVFLDKVSHPYHLKMTFSTRSVRDSDYDDGDRKSRRPLKRKAK